MRLIVLTAVTATASSLLGLYLYLKMWGWV